MSISNYAHGQMLYQNQGNSNIYLQSNHYDINRKNYVVFLNELKASWSTKSRREILVVSPSGSVLNTFALDSNYNISYHKVFNNSYYYLGTRIINDSTFVANISQCDSNFKVIRQKSLTVPNYYFSSFTKIVLANNYLYAPLEVINLKGPQNFFKIYKMDMNLNTIDSLTISSNSLRDFNTLGNNLIYSIFGTPTSSISAAPIEVHQIDKDFNPISVYRADSMCLNQLNYYAIGFSNGNLLDLGNNKYALITNASLWFDYGYSAITAIIENNKCKYGIKIGSVDPKFSSHLEDRRLCSSSHNNAIFSVLYCSKGSPTKVPSKFPVYFNVHKIDTNGSLIWSKYFGYDKWYYPTSIFATDDSGAVVCGLRYDTINPQVPDAAEGFVMKIDKDGNQEMVSVLELNRKKISITCFPNPTENEIAFELPNNEAFELRIYDMQGKELLVNLNYRNQSKQNIKHLNKATYFYTIKQKDQLGSGRFVKE